MLEVVKAKELLKKHKLNNHSSVLNIDFVNTDLLNENVAV